MHKSLASSRILVRDIARLGGLQQRPRRIISHKDRGRVLYLTYFIIEEVFLNNFCVFYFESEILDVSAIKHKSSLKPLYL